MCEITVDLPYGLAERMRALVAENTFFSAKQRRLLVEPLICSWHPPVIEGEVTPCQFLADSDVDIFFSLRQPPVTPDMFLSLDVQVKANAFEDAHRAYFWWEFEKLPEVVVDIATTLNGTEIDAKIQRYARMGIAYHVIFDPFCVLSSEKLRVHELTMGGRRYRRRPDFELPEVGLTMQLWRGEFEDVEAEWLRWCDAGGNIIPTGAEGQRSATERANAEAQRANAEAERANAEAQRASAEATARQRVEAELENLRAELQRLKKSREV